MTAQSERCDWAVVLRRVEQLPGICVFPVARKMGSSRVKRLTEGDIRAATAHVARPGSPRSARAEQVTAPRSIQDLTPRKELGLRLRQARESVPGMTAKQLAGIIGIDGGLASRIERGTRWPQPSHVRAWAKATNLGDAEADDLVELLADARRRDSDLRSAAPYAPKAAQVERSRLFQAAARIRTVAITEIPSYLQAAEYARQALGDEVDAGDIAALRQADGNQVGKPGKYFEIILAESALRFLPCDAAAMRGQIGRLHGLIGAPGVEFGIIPFGERLATPVKNAFSVFDDTTVIDTFAGEVKLTPREASRYVKIVDQLWDEAVRGESAREILTAATKALPAS